MPAFTIAPKGEIFAHKQSYAKYQERHTQPRARGPNAILASVSCKGLGLGLVAVWSFLSPSVLVVPKRFRFSFRWFAFWSSSGVLVSFVLFICLRTVLLVATPYTFAPVIGYKP